MGAEALKKYRDSLTEEQKAELRAKATRARQEQAKRTREQRRRSIEEARNILTMPELAIPEVDKPAQIAIDRIVELAARRVPLQKIRRLCGEISDKAWENLKNYAFKEGVNRPEDAAFLIQKNAEAHAKVLKKRIKLLKREVKIAECRRGEGSMENFRDLLKLLLKSEDDLFAVQTIALEKSYRVGAFGNKKGANQGGIVVKFNIPRPPPVIKDVTPIIEIDKDD